MEYKDQNGKLIKTEKEKSEYYTNILNYLDASLEFLEDKGYIPKGHSNPPKSIFKIDFPSKVVTKDGVYWNSFVEKIDGVETIFMDNSLKYKDEIVYTIMHEIVHTFYPRMDEHNIQVRAARYLLDIYNSYEWITHPANERNFKDIGIKSKFLSKDEIRTAFNKLVRANAYGVNKRNVKEEIIKSENSDDLESRIRRHRTYLLLIITTFLFVSSVFFNPSITGNVIGPSNSNNISVFLILLGLISGLFYLLLIKKPIV